MAAELTFTPEAIPPAPPRVGGDGREPIKWEEKLAPVKEQPLVDGEPQSFRVWTYEKKSGAQSRRASVRDRLFLATPKDKWTILVRPIPNTTDFGVYVRYEGEHTDDELAAITKERADRAAKTAAAKSAAATADGTAPEETSTPAQKVAQAKAGAGRVAAGK